MVRIPKHPRGFSLIECVICLVIVMIVGLAAIGSIIFSRQSMELDKQRTAALNYCRTALEEAETMANVTAGTKTLVPFNSPGLEIDANVSVTFYEINSDGTIFYDTPLVSRPNDRAVFCLAEVAWVSTGRWSRLRKVSMSSIVRAGSL